MNLNETINQIQGTEITEGSKVAPQVLRDSKHKFDLASEAVDKATDSLGDIGHALADDPKLQGRVVTLFRQLLKVQSTFGKIRF